jgi:phospholipase/lecithinase/hemolysin
MTAFISTQQLEPLQELVVFGDSLSDTGTVFRATGGMYPPSSTYFKGRYSNGRVWVEYLADRLHLTTHQIRNFACGGATSSSDLNSMVPGLLTQVQSFAQTHSHLNAKALYVLWAGANDYLQGAANAAIPVENLMRAIAALVQQGVKKFLVANLPDLGQLPTTRYGANAASLSALAQAHNQGLRRSLKQLAQQHPDLQIATFDVHMLYREAIADPARFGFTNVTQTAMTTSSNPEQFLFWDGIHPTTAAHRILGDRAFAALELERLTVAR